ncbi:ion transporter [Reichenbachiella carrageenanivorans]|uniref:Ion transporter n=1 Tax=Reichenbachiella carrageenanivorans TaxID=2979869 RepID=A0ABY6D4V6_9BACT|nr:ion transporter [Reichenbachiella carrageenanivorans]UXX81194.1 ion transporter [Reichenbachiella carrageenanivorans]
MANHREKLGAFLESTKFQHFIVSLIVLNSITIGMETSKSWMNSYGAIFEQVDEIILGIFVLEVVLKIYAFGFRFFKSAWNIFDFLIVAIAAIPAAGAFSVFRTIRILRTLRLIKNVPKLRVIIEALIKSIPSIGWIMVLLVTVFYIFAVLATNLYGNDFPQWFGSMGASMFTLFQIMTLESWSSGIARPMMKVIPHAYLFFIPFILIATYTTLNIFIAIVVNTMNELHMQDVKDEEEIKAEIILAEHRKSQVQIEALSRKVDELIKKLNK